MPLLTAAAAPPLHHFLLVVPSTRFVAADAAVIIKFKLKTIHTRVENQILKLL